MIYQAGINAIQREDLPIHDWYRFVLSYPPHLVRQYLERFGVTARQRLLDPFCGTGTTLVEAKKSGVRSVGCDAHPFAVLVSRVKTDWTLDVELLSKLLRSILVSAEQEMIRQNLPPLSFYTVLVREESASRRNGYSLTDEEAKLLPTGFVSERPLRRLLILREEIERHTADQSRAVREFFLVGMAHVIANHAGNFAFGPEIYRTKAKADVDVLEHYAGHVNRMILELQRVQTHGWQEVESEVFLDDARKLEKIPPGIHAVITSPPYPNEKDYTRTTRVESLLLGLLKSRDELRRVKEGLLRSNTRNVFVGDDDGSEVSEFPDIRAVCERIERRRIELNKTSGFEKLYHKVVAHYFGGMRRHFRALRPLLKPNAKLAYVVGDQLSFLMVPIATGKLLGQIAEAEGFRVVGLDLWRERVGTKVRNAATKTRSVRVREEVLLLEKR